MAERAGVYTGEGGTELVLYNGLVKRTFRIEPDAACIEYRNMTDGRQVIRAVKPEARVTIDGQEYNVGGLYGQKQNAYMLRQWPGEMERGREGFHFVSYVSGPAIPHIDWRPGRWWLPGECGQAAGVRLSLRFASQELEDVDVYVHYEIYDALPLMCKWVSVENRSGAPLKIGRVVNEILAVAEEQSAVFGRTEDMARPSHIYVETDYAFNNAMCYELSDQTAHWIADSTYTSQVNYDLRTPCLLEVYPEQAPGITLARGGVFKSVRTYELLHDSYDRDRRGLAVRRMYRAIAPWTAGNPVFMHLVSRTDREVYEAIDQCAATGYEALILSFGSHLKMENPSPENHSKWKAVAGYAHSKDILIGGYTLFSSRSIDAETDVIDLQTGKPGGAFFGNAPCFCSRWGLDYRDNIIAFFKNTGFDILEMDGPYPGDLCASTSHPGHEGLDDSQWRQMEVQKSLFHWMAANGVYVNTPDWYFLDGTNKTGLGYRETNFALPRAEQKILNRQNIYDGTWEKTPSMGWGFVPLTQYHGGGADAVLEPLSEHLDDYRRLMMQYYGAGVQACFRGPRLYDTEETRRTVAEVVEWYKKYRRILNADIIHLRRADGRDWDGIMHVDPEGVEKGLIMLYNPLEETITRTIKLPMYYTGLDKSARIREQEGRVAKYGIGRDYTVDFTFTLGPGGYSWYVVE